MKRTSLFAVALLSLLSGCTPTRFTAPLVNIYANTASIGAPAADQTFADQTVSATCPDGQPLMGGAFKIVSNISPTGSPSTLVLASFPSESSWTVTARRYANVPDEPSIIAVVYCYARQQSHPIQTTIVSQTMTLAAKEWSLEAVCPRAAALTGGGFKSESPLQDDLLVNGGILGSYPGQVVGIGNQFQWVIQVGDYLAESRTYDAYAICATSGLTQVVPFQVSTFSSPTTSSLQNGDFLTQCDSSAFTTGAGFLLGNGGMLSQPHSVSAVDVQQDFSAGHLMFNEQNVQPPPQVFASCLKIP